MSSNFDFLKPDFPEIYESDNDKSYSLTDCISFTIMRQLNINNALTFDQHFAQAGFQKIP